MIDPKYWVSKLNMGIKRQLENRLWFPKVDWQESLKIVHFELFKMLSAFFGYLNFTEMSLFKHICYNLINWNMATFLIFFKRLNSFLKISANFKFGNWEFWNSQILAILNSKYNFNTTQNITGPNITHLEYNRPKI